MARKRTVKLKCPICKQSVTSSGEDFPFCSERCRVIDLGKWASGQYVVSSPALDTPDDGEIQNFPGIQGGEDDES
ncbi:MAG TPA: DNA gyrase inhibitor YacG [Terriglobales bacterium]